MTAVQWLVKELGLEISEAVETALEIEQTDIEEAFQLGELNENAYQHTGRRIHKNSDDYYTITYKKK
jgi:antitoxin component of MazEF toxin-antitoxin module